MKKVPVTFKGQKFKKYLAGDDGNIYNLKGEKLKPWDDTRGYDVVDLMSDDNIAHRAKVHLIIAHSFLGKQKEGMIVEHNNGKKKDCRPSNLSYETQRENVARAQVLIKGVKYLTPEEKESILTGYKEGMSITELGEVHKLPYHVIRDLKNGKTYNGI